MKKIYNCKGCMMVSMFNITKIERVFKIILLISIMAYQPLFGKEQKCQSFEETIKSYIPQMIIDVTKLVSDLVYEKKEQKKSLKTKSEKKISQKNFEELEKSIGVMKGKYEDTYWVVSGLSEYLEMIRVNTDNWYRATTKKTQNKSKKNLEEAGAFAVVDFLRNPQNKKYTKYLPKKMQKILQSKINKASIDSVAEYMREIKKLEKTFQKNKVFSNIKKLKEQLAAGKEHFKNVESLINFTKTFNPNGINKPTDRLRKISGVLKYANTFTQKVPLIGTLIDCYARIAEEFADALDKLDKNIQKSRVGSLGGKLDTSGSPQACFIALKPENELITYLYENYDNLAPFKVYESFEAHHVFLTKQDGSRCFHFERGTAFSKVYNGYLYLTQQGKKIFINDFIQKVSVFSDTNGGIKFYKKQKNRANKIYKMIPKNDYYKSSFYRLLEKANQYKHYRLYSLKGKKLPKYKNFDEFFAYWIFDNNFRSDVQNLVNKYRDKEFLEGRIIFSDFNNNEISRPKNSKIHIDNKSIILKHGKNNIYYFETILTSNKKHNYKIGKNKGWALYKKEKIKYLNTDKNGKDKPFYTYVSLRFKKKGESSLNQKKSSLVDKIKNGDTETVPSDEDIETGEGSKEQKTKGTGQDNNIKLTPPVGDGILNKNDLKGNGKTGKIKPVPSPAPPKDTEKGSGVKKESTKEVSEDDDTVKEDDTKKEETIDKGKLTPQKWDWFKKDVPRYFNKLFAKSEGEYGILERKVHQFIAEKKGTQEEADKCLVDAKKEAKELRKEIGAAKKEHPVVFKKMHDDQGSSTKVLKHIEGFVTKYKIPKDLNVAVSYSSPCLDNFDDNATKELKVSISGRKSYRIKPTETVTLNAVASGGKAPVKISWEGGNISPSGATAIFAATTPGSYTVQVTAKDASGQSKSDSVTIVVKKIDMPKLSGLPNEVYYGTSKIISVEGIENNAPKDKLSSDDPCKGHVRTSNPFDPCNKIIITKESHADSDAPSVIMISPIDEDVGAQEIEEEEEGEYEYVWISSEKGVEFNPPSGKEPQVKVTFGNIGNVEIWAEVHKDGELVGETEPIKTKVIPPKFTLSVKPEILYMGDEGKATITVKPNIDDKFTDFRWLPMGKNAQKLIESGNGRSTTFKLRSIKPATIEVLVHAKSPYYGGEIGKVKYVVSAKPYKVSVSKPKRLDKAPWKWDSKQGKAVELPNAIAVFQNAEVHVMITPEPKERVSYKWTVTPDGCTLSAPMSKSTNLNAHEAKIYVVTVKVSDKNGIEIGTSSISHTVTVSQRDLDIAKQKAKDQEKAKELLQEGRKLWKGGKLQQAITTLTQAQKLAGKDKEIAKSLKAMQKQKKDLDVKLDKASNFVKKGKLKDAEAILSQTARISDKYKRYKEVLKQLADAKKKAEEKKKQIAKLLKDAKVLKDAGNLDEAVTVLKKGSGNKKIDKLLREVKTQQNVAHKKMTEGQSQWKNGALDKAVSTLKEASKIDTSNKQITKVLKGMKSQKKTVDDALNKADRLIKEKKFDHAKSALVKAKYVSKLYPSYIDMVKRLNDAVKEEEKRKEELAKKIKAIKERIVKEKKAKAAAKKKAEDNKAALAKKINDIKIAIEAKEKAEAQKREEAKNAALAKKIQDIKAAAKKAAEVKAEKERKESPTAKADTVSKKYVLGFAGKWHSTYGVMTLTVQGLHVSGNYTHDKGRIEAVLSEDGKTLKGTWAEAPSYKGSRDAGKMYFKLSSDGKKIDGLWSYGDAVPTRRWTATRIIDTQTQAPAIIKQKLPQAIKPASKKPTVNIAFLVGSWSFGRSKHYGKPVHEHLCDLVLTDHLVPGKGYKIKSCHSNESYWILEGKVLLFVALDGTITTKFSEVRPNYWEGTYVGSAHSAEGVVHYLKKSDESVNTTKPSRIQNIVGKTKTSTSYAPNNKGDVFKGGHWAGASGGSDWIQKDFSTPQFVTGISIAKASTDVTTRGFRLTLKLKKGNGRWITIDELRDTNINRTALSGGAIGKSIPSYSKKLSPAIKATAFRLEFKGHGWFDATDIRIYSQRQTNTRVLDTAGIDGIVDIEQPMKLEKSPVKIVTSTSFESDVSAGKIKNIVKTKATLSFWNVGTKVSGYGDATMDVKSVSSLNGSTQKMHYSGTFSGGPNGVMKLSDGKIDITLKVINGKRVKVDGQEVYFGIPDFTVFK